MCCFSPVAKSGSFVSRLFSRAAVHVSDTQIFARHEGEEQILVYSMLLSTPGDVAMILPLPVLQGVGEAALEFVDLSGYRRFFEDLERAFVLPAPLARSQGASLRDILPRPRLVVHEVGAFEASFVPSPQDFDRLDPRFRLPPVVFSKVPAYHDYGFAVFQLRRGDRKRIHPMAFRFRTRATDQLFFPTLHVHDGRVRDTARFAHRLYYQGGESGELLSLGKLGGFVRVGACQGLIHPEEPAWRISVHGRQPNRDTWIRAQPM